MPVTPIEGYASVYGMVDSNMRIFMPGVFSGWLAANPGMNLPILWFHKDEKLPVGTTTKLWEDEIGLRYEGELADTVTGNDAAELIRQSSEHGMQYGTSFRFFNGVGDYNDNMDLVIESADIDEITVLTPYRQANKLATSGLLGKFQSPAVEYMKTIEAVRRAMTLATAA